MNQTTQQQVYLLDSDVNVMCRIIGLYAARGIAVAAIEYRHAAPKTMSLLVHAEAPENLLRVLVEKASSFVGVIEVAQRRARVASMG